MGTNQTTWTGKYNEKTYTRYTFRVRQESELAEALKDFTGKKGTSLNFLITKLLNDHFNLDPNNTKA